MDDSKAPTAAERHLVFDCGGAWYAVPAEFAVEVVTFPALTPVPGGPAHVRGVFNHRGEIVAVVDLARLLGLGAEDAGRAVLLRLPQGAFALSARMVAGVLPLQHTFTPQGSDGIRAHVSAPEQEGDRRVVFLEPKGLFHFLSSFGAPRA